jgi:4-amino-4-deoxy-L-arabinose transferase-like glycosyltransferase
MPRGTRDKARSRSRSTPENPRPSSDCTSSEPAGTSGNTAEASVFRFKAIDALLVSFLLGLAMLLIADSGFVSGPELWPMPDAVEYAALAVNLDRGLGPVLHFGGNTYPSRYTIGYPLILAAAYPTLGRRPERLCLVTALTALIAIAGLYVLTSWIFDRPSAILAGLLLATSPHFLGLSTCVLSDVPSLAVVILAALAFLYAEEKQSLAASALCGLLVGLSVTIRVTNGVVLVGMLAAGLLVRPRGLQFARVIAFAIGFIAFPGLQACLNLHYLGSALSNGYGFWQPETYISFLTTFEPRYLFVPWDSAHQHGNFVAYAIAMLGLDGVLGQLNLGTESRTLFHARYGFYPFPVVVFAGLGVFLAIRRKRCNVVTIRAIYLGLGFLASLLLVYLPYFYVEPRFLLPALFIVFATAGYGLVSANRRLEAGWAGLAVIALDAVLVGAIMVQTVARLAMPQPWQSKLVADVLAMRPQLTNAVLVSDISLQWLELHAGGEGTEFVGLSSNFGEQPVNEEHLHWLYVKKSKGWSGPIPPILLLPNGGLDPAEASKLAAEDKEGRPVYLLILRVTSSQWFDVRERQVAEIDRAFSLERIAHYPEMTLYRLTPH